MCVCVWGGEVLLLKRTCNVELMGLPWIILEWFLEIAYLDLTRLFLIFGMETEQKKQVIYLMIMPVMYVCV